jgi:phosphoenolpyruvate---glycerone phosphotransferase subunit DhaL
MEILRIEDFKRMISLALINITARGDEFSALDAVIGDGDHGTAIVQALNAVNEASEKGTEFKAMLDEVGFNVMLKTSGSTSTLLGGFFLGMSDAAKGTTLNVQEVKAMFRGALSGVQKQTKAKRGDKTIMDALIPAVEAIETCDSPDLKVIFQAGADAALKGAAETAQMKANYGRARNYGERSVNHVDPGAASWSCMFESFAQALNDKN